MNNLTVPASPNDHSLGPNNALITIVEYGRYDCPQCRQAFITLGAVRKLYDAPLRLIYRHFPIETPRSVSERAAEAAEAAGKQGKFWEMHVHLLENQQALDDAGLLASAAMLGLDVRRFAADLETGVHTSRVREQFRGGLESGVHNTPTFFINGVRHDDDWDTDTLLSAIRASA